LNLEKYDLDNLLLAAIKSEVESNTLYLKIAKKTENGLLQDKLRFLAKEEDRHRLYVEEIYKENFPKKEIILPKETPVPLPKIEINEDMPISKLLKKAMDAEKHAHEFYELLAKRFESGSKIYNTLLYFADMETGHYKILEIEMESMERFEEADEYWPMMHVGP